MRPDKIDLNRTASTGVAGLKAFLQFAENGHLALRPDELKAVERGGIGKSICEKLEAKGFKTRSNIGTSGFKIDIGVVHPNNPEVFILGIITDGKYYRDAETTNDRESVMPSMLRHLGWNLHRVWTLDWHEHIDRIMKEITASLEELQSQVIEEPTLDDKIAEVNEPAVELQAELENETVVITKRRPYTSHYLVPIASGGYEAIYEFQNRNHIKEQILAVVNKEAPISKGLLYKKVVQAWNTSRVGSRLDKHLEMIIGELDLKQVHHHQPFYWNTEIGTYNIDWYRSNDTEKRNIEDIAPEELKAAITEAVYQNLSIEKSRTSAPYCQSIRLFKSREAD